MEYHADIAVDVAAVEARARKLRAQTFAHGMRVTRDWVVHLFSAPGKTA